MTKKTLLYVCLGLLCCSIGVYSLNAANVKKSTAGNRLMSNTNTNVAVPHIEKVDETTQLSGVTTQKSAEEQLAAEQTKMAVEEAKLTALQQQQESLTSSTTPESKMETIQSDQKADIQIMKAAYNRMQNGEPTLPGDKALIERLLSQYQVMTFSSEDQARDNGGRLDENGGVNFTSSHGPVSIADNVCTNAATITVSGFSGNLTDVECTIINLTHTWDSDLDISLIGPTAVTIDLTSDNGGSGDNYINTLLDDEATTLVTAGTAPFSLAGGYRPEQALSAFDGTNPNGVWTLRICDDAGGDTGTLTSWRLQILAPVGGPANLAVTNLAPCGTVQPNATQSISCTVTNIGGAASAATSAYNVFDGTTSAAFAIAALNPGAFVNVVFPATVDLTLGAHTLRAYVSTVDANAVDDTTACASLTGVNCADFSLTAPGVVSGNTLGAGDNCALDTGEEQIVQLTIPAAGQYIMSLCGADTWDSYMYLTTSCCGGTTLAQDDDASACGLSSEITYTFVAAGVYYLDIEPFSTGAGPWTLTVTQVQPGRCCYGANQCSTVVSQTICNNLFGLFTANQTCAANPCPTCTITIPGGATEEGEACTNNTPPNPDNFDGGCNSTPNVFLPLVCGQTYHGTGTSSTAARDTDWYRVITTVDDTLRLSYRSNAPSNFAVVGGNCAAQTVIFQSVGLPACSLLTFTSACLPADTYFVVAVAAPGFINTNCADYLLTLISCTPCNLPVGRCCYNQGVSCLDTTQQRCTDLAGSWNQSFTCGNSTCPTPCTEFSLTAPGSVSGNTTGAGDDCNLRTGADQSVRVTIPTAGDWTFSLCTGGQSWDSFIYLTTACCGGTTLNSNDDGCAPLSIITCQTIATPGDYWIDIEPWSSATGAWTLVVSSCIPPNGRCCYNNGANCADTTQAYCTGTLLGTWSSGLTCTANPCPIPPANDNCNSATTLALPAVGDSTVVDGDLTNASNSCTSTCDLTSSGPDVFYSLTLTSCARIALVLTQTSTLVGDGHISVYDGLANCCGCEILCNDDQANSPSAAWDPGTYRSTGFSSYVSAELPAGTYLIRVGHWSTSTSVFHLKLVNLGPCGCEVSCLPNFTTPECAENYCDSTFWDTDPDGGCFNTVPAYCNIACGANICGRLATPVTDDPAIPGAGYYWDTDWYTFTVATDPKFVTITVTAGLPVDFLLYDAGQSSPCDSVAAGDVIDGMAALACGTNGVLTDTLQPGFYGFAISPSDTGGYPVSTPYTLSVTCASLCTPDQVDSLTAKLIGTDILLRWEADPTFTGVYDVYATTVNGGVGDFATDYGTPIATGIAPVYGNAGPGAGNTTYLDVNPLGANQKRFYRVVGRCP